jgi:CheY-like chemotaxis protein
MSEPQRLKVIDAGRPNTLGLTQAALKLIVEKLDAAEKGKSSTKRNFSRWPFVQASIKIAIVQPSGSEVTLKLAARNISRGGVSLLHNCFVHPGSQVTVSLPRLAGGTKEVPGSVKRCLHRRGVLHEIGVSFEEEIELREFVGVARGTDLFSLEKIEPDKLIGTVLHVEDNDVDARMFQHFLRETQLRVKRAKTGLEGVDMAVQEFSLIVSDWRLPDITGTEMIRRVRELGVETPVILSTSDPLGLMKEGLWDEAHTGMVSKPLVQQNLLRAIAEHLLVVGHGQQAEPPRSSSLNVSGNLVEYNTKLNALLEKPVQSELREICAAIRSAGAGSGDNNLMRVAENASNILDAKGVETAKPLLRELLRLTAGSKAA